MKKLLISLLLITSLFFFFITNKNVVKAEENNNINNFIQHDLTKDTLYFTKDEVKDKKLTEEINHIRSSLVNYILKIPALLIRITNTTKYVENGYNETKTVEEKYTLDMKLQDLYNLGELRRLDVDYVSKISKIDGNTVNNVSKTLKLENFYTIEGKSMGFLSLYEKTYKKADDGKETTTYKENDYEVVKFLPIINNLYLFENIPFLYADFNLKNENLYKTPNNGYSYRNKDKLFIFDEKLVLKHIIKYNKQIEGFTNEDFALSSKPYIISQADVELLHGNYERIRANDLNEETFIYKIGKYKFFNDKPNFLVIKITGAILIVFMTISLFIGTTIVLIYNNKPSIYNKY